MIGSIADRMKMYTRFCLGLGGYMKEKTSFEQAGQIVKERMLKREENFLRLIKKGVFDYRKSPYRPLFNLARCGYEDVERMVSNEGIEGTLAILRDKGIYISIEEFKGKQPIIRDGSIFKVRERDFDNPYTARCYERRSGATRSAGTRTVVDFEFLADTAANRGLIADMWGLSGSPFVIIRPASPYGAGTLFMLHLSKFDIYPVKWFSLYDERNVPISLKSRFGLYYILFMGNLFGAKFPRPDLRDFGCWDEAVAYVARLLDRHKSCCIFTNVSSATRICSIANAKSISLQGLTFQGCGEPLTDKKRDEIESAGARYVLYYAFTEAGLTGCHCLHASEIDDIHLFEDSFAFINRTRPMMDTSVEAFLVTSLLGSSPKILLNVESGDYGKIERRGCGCPYEALGFRTHIHTIRSFEKLSGEGMTFYGTDAVKIVEDILPSRFGGSGLDYQLVEEEDEKGFTRLLLYASPSLGPLDEEALAQSVIAAFSEGDHSRKIMARIYDQAGVIKVKREPPMVTGEGKLYPLHIRR